MCTHLWLVQSLHVDIDECGADPPVCDPAKTTDCINIDGDYRCRCKSGYHLSANGHSCEGKHTAYSVFMLVVKHGALSAQVFIKISYNFTFSLLMLQLSLVWHYSIHLMLSAKLQLRCWHLNRLRAWSSMGYKPLYSARCAPSAPLVQFVSALSPSPTIPSTLDVQPSRCPVHQQEPYLSPSPPHPAAPPLPSPPQNTSYSHSAINQDSQDSSCFPGNCSKQADIHTQWNYCQEWCWVLHGGISLVCLQIPSNP